MNIISIPDHVIKTERIVTKQAGNSSNEKNKQTNGINNKNCTGKEREKKEVKFYSGRVVTQHYTQSKCMKHSFYTHTLSVICYMYLGFNVIFSVVFASLNLCMCLCVPFIGRNAVVVNEDNSAHIQNWLRQKQNNEKKRKHCIKSQKCTYKYAKDVSLITLFA